MIFILVRWSQRGLTSQGERTASAFKQTPPVSASWPCDEPSRTSSGEPTPPVSASWPCFKPTPSMRVPLEQMQESVTGVEVYGTDKVPDPSELRTAL